MFYVSPRLERALYTLIVQICVLPYLSYLPYLPVACAQWREWLLVLERMLSMHVIIAVYVLQFAPVLYSFVRLVRVSRCVSISTHMCYALDLCLCEFLPSLWHSVFLFFTAYTSDKPLILPFVLNFHFLGFAACMLVLLA